MIGKGSLRVGFVGTGWTEKVQIPMFRRAGLTLQAICSGNPENAKRVAAAADLPETHDDWQTLVTSDSVDIVSIVTPPHLHAEIAIAALQAGKHVICEKPTALNVAEAEAMFAAAQAAPNQLAIIDHELRYHPQRIQMRQLIRDGYVGNLIHVKFERLGGERLNPAPPWRWWDDATRGGGMLGAVGSHLLDMARWTVGRIDALSAQLQTVHLYRQDAEENNQRVTADDHAHLQLHFANDISGTMTVSGITPSGYGMNTLAVGNKGALRLDNEDQLWGAQGDAFHRGDWQRVETDFPAAEITDLAGQNPFAIGTYYLGKRLAEALPAEEYFLEEAASFYDGLVVQRMLDAARKSHSEQIWVEL